MAGISSKAAGTPGNKYKYNGKEEQRQEFSNGSGLEWLDFGHRMYDNQIGRFFTQDLMVDNFPSFSPYQYARNNPILYMDIMGDSAWKITNEWNDDYINKFQTFASDRAKQAYENGERYTCEDFALSTIIDFSSQNGLPLVIENGEYSLSASSPSYDNVKDFKDAAFATTGANDLARPENAVQLSGTNSTKSGDLLLHKVEAENGSKKVYGHVQVVASNTERAIVIYQGNQRSGSSDPNAFFSRYAGMKVQQGYYAKATGNYVRTDTKSVTPNLLNSGVVVPFRWNFTSWNKR